MSPDSINHVMFGLRHRLELHIYEIIRNCEKRAKQEQKTQTKRKRKRKLENIGKVTPDLKMI